MALGFNEEQINTRFCYLTKVSILISRATIVATKTISNDAQYVALH
jgi:hypothetical protein